MKNVLFTLSLFLVSGISFAQIIVMDVVQVKEGMSNDYEAVEKFVAPIMELAVENGDKMGWYIFKRLEGGDLSEAGNKGIGDYMIINVYKDEAQMNAQSVETFTAYAKKAYKGKMSNRAIDRRMNSLMDAREDTRTYVLENIYYTKPNSLNVGDVVTVFPAEQLNSDYEQFEMEFYRPMWEKNILTGAHRAWNFNRIIDRTENAYQNLTHIIFNVAGIGELQFDTDFLSTKLAEMGQASRKGFDPAQMQLIHIKE